MVKNEKFYTSPTFYVYLIVVIIIAIIGMMVGREYYKSKEYVEMKKSVLNPPNIVFPIVWTILFVFIIIAGYLGDVGMESESKRRMFRILFAIMLGLNLLWTICFTRGFILGALIDCIALVIVNIIICVMLFNANKTAFFLYLIYTIWTAFALYLNFEIVRLDRTKWEDI